MSGNTYGLLSLSATQDHHFASAFMQGYGGHHQPYDHERYTNHSHSSQYIHSPHNDIPTRDSYLQDRRVSEPYLRNTLLPRHTYPGPPSFDYASQPNALAHAEIVRREPAEHGASLRHLIDFDPRPPHAGWTPKQEVDDETQTRELLSSNLSRTSPSSELGLHPAPVSPRDDSLSPGGPASGSASSKTYSFVSLPGNAVRKRPRRRYDEIERLYTCSWPDCSKAYGTLNHLNAHVSMQRHGQKRNPAEFKELRKQWRQQKKQDHTLPSSTIVGSDLGLESHMRRRATEPNILLPRDHTLIHPQANTHLQLNHRLSLGDLRFPEEDHSALTTSPTSTSASDAYWQDSPLSTHYPLSMVGGQNPSPPPALPPPTPIGVPRLGGDGTLLTPLPSYRPSPPTTAPPISRLGPGSTLLQPLSAGTLASLSSPTRSPAYHEYQNHDQGVGPRSETA